MCVKMKTKATSNKKQHSLQLYEPQNYCSAIELIKKK